MLPHHHARMISWAITDREAPRDYILRFWTSVATISIGRTPVQARDTNCPEYPVRIPGQKESVSTIILDNEWRRSSGGEYEVISLSRSGKDCKPKYDIRLWTMLIKWEDDTAYRIQQVIFPIRFVH